MPADDRDRAAGEQEDGELRDLDRLIGSILNALKGRGTEGSWERRCYYDALAAFGRMPRLAQLLQGRREAEARVEEMREEAKEFVDAALDEAKRDLDRMAHERDYHCKARVQLTHEALEAAAQLASANDRAEKAEKTLAAIARAYFASCSTELGQLIEDAFNERLDGLHAALSALPEARETEPHDCGGECFHD